MVDPKENIPDIPEEEEEKLFFLQNPVEREEYEKAKRFLLEYPKGEKPNEDWYKAHYTVWGYEKFANDDQLKEDLKDYITEDERANAPSLVPSGKNRDGYTIMKQAPAQKTIYSEQGLKKKADAIENGLKVTDELIDKWDTNDNGKIEKDEMADFQKSLDDYAKKNPKGRDDIPVTTRR